MEARSLKYLADALEAELITGSPDLKLSRVCTDSRHAQPGDLFFALSGERFDGHAFLPQVAQGGVAAVVAERGKIPAQLPPCGVLAVENVRRALGRLAGVYRRDFKLPVVAVGGSNGKTGTKELIASVLRQKGPTLWSQASFNNEIGVPLTLLQLAHNHQAAVVEAGTNHPGELAPLLQMVRPDFGVVTNIGREHLEYFGDLAGVAQEEGAMAEVLPAGGRLFLNGDDEWSGPIAARTRAQVVRVGLGGKNDCVAERVRFTEEGVVFSIQSSYGALNGEYRLQLLGRHQVVNALLAFAVGAELGLSGEEISRGLAECLPVKMRLQLYCSQGIRLLDDSYNANADSMLAALQTLCELPCSGRRVAVLGDMAELGACSLQAHQEVGRRVADLKVDHLLTIGKRAAEIASMARKAGVSSVREFEQVEDAVPVLHGLVRAGDLVLIKASRSMRLERVREALQSGDAAK